MPSEIKRRLTEAFTQDLENAQDLVLLDASRLPAKKSGELRGRLEEAGIRLRVVKNHLAKLALENAGLPAMDALFNGPTAIALGGEGAGKISKLLTEWNKKEVPVTLKGGLLEGKLGGAQDVEIWAKLPTRPEMLSAILGGILSPASGVGAGFHASLAQFANLVAAHIEKMEKE
jgi:large subunit ribosomal protein L10